MSEKIFYNAVTASVGGDYGKLAKLSQHFGTWQDAYDHLPGRSRLDPEKAWEKLQQHSISLILRDESAFPDLLREIPFPPFGLYYRGEPLGTELKMTMVGTRKATPAGLYTARTIAKELSQRGLTIVSGLALGIDAASHQGALDNKGKTIAVLACGLDRVYPSEHSRLARSILETSGTLVSEYPIGPPTYQNRFLERNRIGSGLSKAVVVIEAPERSGTLATARFAIEQNRDVYVVPGATASPNYVGSHRLIRSGAALVTSAADILENLGLAPKTPDEKAAQLDLSFLDKNQRAVLDILAGSGKPMHTDEIVARVELSDAQVNAALAGLTISSIIKETGGKYFV